MELSNKTKQDALERVLDAKMGCLVNATDDFILALRAELARWDSDLQVELAKRMQRYARQEGRAI